jgi:hypothetical protein
MGIVCRACGPLSCHIDSGPALLGSAVLTDSGVMVRADNCTKVRLPLSTASERELHSKQPHKKETMTTKDHLARHDSQIARLEQVMTALAEAQVKTEEAQERLGRDMSKLARAMAVLAESHAETEATTRALSRQWEAYLNTLRKN